MKIEIIIKIIEHLSKIIKAIYNKDSKPSQAKQEAQNGDQRGIEKQVFKDAGNPSSVNYSKLSTRKSKDRGNLVD